MSFTSLNVKAFERVIFKRSSNAKHVPPTDSKGLLFFRKKNFRTNNRETKRFKSEQKNFALRSSQRDIFFLFWRSTFIGHFLCSIMNFHKFSRRIMSVCVRSWRNFVRFKIDHKLFGFWVFFFFFDKFIFG